MNKKNEPQKAVALQYDGSKVAPEVVATGLGKVAENIIEIGKKNNVPVYEDAKLATLLTALDLGDTIPEELYEVVAQVLAFVGDIDELYGKIQRKK